ncbi:YceI family protein [Pontibacter actiniarum]|uniref:Polyisoprenoid-binding protein n=1 Tax=Pontibacter actiniarum TaxID=323450 RepID=A0A1X9YNZ9_9BACT|nr:YceI family protein [Pontibacter actiniarum]ARS34616.1 polyisoprenoid-binding protein [Pontibacter actiniarum]
MATTKWNLDPTHSELGFKIKHMMISNVTGKFTQFDVTAETEDTDFSNAQVVANVDVASINTNNEQRDEHLRNADFFGTEAHPTMKFVSTKVEKIDEDTFTLHGDLTIKDTTKPVKLTVEDNGTATDPWGNVKAGFSISGKINRKDWGINYNAALETGGVMLGEELKIQGEVQLVKQA